MNGADTVRQIYLQYAADADAAERRHSPADGLFGLGKRAADDPCHTAFLESLSAALTAFRQENPDSAAVREVLACIYEAPAAHRQTPAVYWMMIAAHGLTAELTGCLNKEDAAALHSAYGRQYRRWERLPVQREIFRALKRAAEGG